MSQRRASHRRRVAVITGTRAEYGLLTSTMRAIARHRRLELQLVVTGMHLLEKFGHTIDDIIRDRWRIDARVRMQTGSDDPLDQATGLARGVAGIARFLERTDSDMVVVLGDRIEAMAGALAGVTAHTIVAHIHGGDVATGDIDDTLRHAITKLAHVHLPATRSAARRIIRMGELPERVHCVGAPGLDDLTELLERYEQGRHPDRPDSHRTANHPREARASARATTASRRVTAGHLAKPTRKRTALIIQHPCGRSAEREHRTMRAILKAVTKARLDCTIVYPNSDRGHTGIIRAIDEHVRRATGEPVEVARSLDRGSYLRRLIEADVLVGNSSSGIIEATTAGTPAVNVGTRQQGRQRAGRSVIDADETATDIARALGLALRLRPKTSGRTVYGNGRAGERIADVLARAPLDDAFRRKRCPY